MFLNTFAYTAVDAIQNSKKYFVNTFVTNEEIKDALIEFVDAQADYTKSAIDAGISVLTKLQSTLTTRNV